MTAVEPSLTFVAGASANTVVAGVTIPSFKVVSVIAAPAGQSWWAAVLSKSGKCFGIEGNSGAGGGTTYTGGVTAWGAGACAAPAAAPAWADGSW